MKNCGNENETLQCLSMKMSLSNQKMRYPWLPYFFSDLCAVAAAYAVTFFLRFHSDLGEALFETVPTLMGLQPGDPGESLNAFYMASAFRLIVILAGVLCTLYALRNLYDGRRFLLVRPIAWDVVVANGVALAIFYSYWYLSRNVHHPRSFFASVMLFNIIFCIAFRHAISVLLSHLRGHHEFDPCRTVIAGSSAHAVFIGTMLEIRRPHGLQVVETLPSVDGEGMDAFIGRIREAIHRQHPDLLICDCLTYCVSDIMRILELTQNESIPVKILSSDLGVLVTRARIPCDMIRGIPLVHFDAPVRGGRLGVCRGILTFVSALASLILSAPVMLMSGLVIRLTSRGPVLFVQERIGVNRVPFRLYKFRTMYDTAEEQLAQIEEFNESDGALFKMRKDPRITPFGRFLRRFSLDELPQLVNVLKGDMVMVGPRPLPRRDFENYYEQWHYSRHGGLPGLTCLWQVSGRSDVGFHDMCILDVYYLRNHNWMLDLKIILRTVRVVWFGEGAY